MNFDDEFNTEATYVNTAGSNNFDNFVDEDPAAEFLAREKRDLADITGNGDANFYDDPFSSQSNTVDRNSPFKNGNSRPSVFFSMLWSILSR